MEFSHIDGDKIYVYEKLKLCKNCGRKMLSQNTMIAFGISRIVELPNESHREDNLCIDCLNKGGFLRKCDICGLRHALPTGFKYRTLYYSGDEAYYEYICKNCVENKKDKVILALASSEETIDIEK
jgi:ribosomal protein S14